jgi:c(7)-type cytochrome triheme protein
VTIALDRIQAAALVLLLAAPVPAVARGMPHWERNVVPEEYGRVTLDASSTRAGIPPVTFDHWRHRTLFTCRLCHVDVGFGMVAGATQVSAATNRGGYHCGACHDGKTRHAGKVVFRSCSASTNLDESPACRRCHRRPDPAQRKRDHAEFTKDLPRTRFGEVDWELAQERLKLVDFLEGVSVQRPPLKMDKEVAIETSGTWMSDAIFSHRKHATWNGCEVCHPEIFPRTTGGAARYTMAEMRKGRHCGACHDKVAFPLADCRLCHVRPSR